MRPVAAELPLLFSKRGCPWCSQAIAFLDQHGIGYRLKDVSADSDAMEELKRLSGQTSVPTLEWDGRILADFGLDELIDFLRARNVKLEDS